MKSIKPGRANSAMGAFGSLFAVGFGVIWTIIAFGMTSDTSFPFNLFPFFGVFFILMGIGQFVFNLKNTTNENRYSTFDIVDGDEEPDSLNQRFGSKNKTVASSFADNSDNDFCPYCGKSIQSDFEFCPKCGRTLLN